MIKLLYPIGKIQYLSHILQTALTPEKDQYESYLLQARQGWNTLIQIPLLKHTAKESTESPMAIKRMDNQPISIFIENFEKSHKGTKKPLH